MRRSLILLAAAAALACDVVEGPGLTLDMGSTCRAIDFQVREASVLPGWQVHAMAIERSGGESAWALATDTQGRLMLQPWPVGPGLDLSGVGLPEQFTLQPGPVEGQSWLVLDREDLTQVWRLDDAELGRLQAGPPLAPPPGPASRRRLVFVEQAPYLLTLPRLADASLIELQLAPLPADTLLPGTPLILPFWQACPGLMEAEEPCYNTPLITGEVVIEALATTEPGSSSVSATLIAMYGTRESETATAVYPSLVASLELGSAGPGQPPTMMRRDHLPLTAVDEVVVNPGQIAADADGLFVLAGLTVVQDTATPPIHDYLMRASHSRGTLDNTVLELYPKDRRSRLLQLGARVALLQRSQSGDTLHIAPLGKLRVDTTRQGSLAIGADAEVLLAGRGQLLIRAPSGTRRVIAGCKDTEPSEPEDE